MLATRSSVPAGSSYPQLALVSPSCWPSALLLSSMSLPDLLNHEHKCPIGFDCAFVNSCPAYTLPCPEGYFCGRYQGYSNQNDIDYYYAVLKEMYQGADVTYDNSYWYIDYQRAIQSKCVEGFYCPSSSEMIICPEGHWCPESSVEPIPCDSLSLCGEGSIAPIEFTNLFLGGFLAVVTLLLSFHLRSKQRNADRATRQFVSKSHSSKSQAADLAEYGSIEIEFHDLTYSVPCPGGSYRDILPSISGHIPASKFTLVLGTTGCGKTTWLRMLSTGGEAATSGEVCYWRKFPTPTSSPKVPFQDTISPLLPDDAFRERGTHRIPNSLLTQCVGHVPQEDILDRSLTVRELLTYSAQARCPALSAEEREAHIQRTLVDLDIAHIADAVIGGGENQAANISGGQLKRVNIAYELVALVSRPAVLLADELTAGLDANVAYELIQTLQDLTIKGVTVVCVLQQPRPEIFAAMDHLFLMAKDGSIVYEGQPEQVSEHLQHKGFTPFSAETSPADFCIDVLTDLAEGEATGAPSSAQPPVLSRSDPSESPLHYHSINLRGTRHSIMSAEQRAWRPGFWLHRLFRHMQEARISRRNLPLSIWLNMQRLMLIRVRNVTQVVVNLFIHVIMAVALSSGFSIQLTDNFLAVFNPASLAAFQDYFPSPVTAYAHRNVNDLAFNQLLFFMSGALGCAASLAAVPVFAGQQAIVQRERRNGLSVLGFALGRMVGDVYFILLDGLVFAGVWCLLGMPGGYQRWLSVVLATSFASSGIGYLSGVLAAKNNASVYAVIFTFICCVFSGSEPTLSQVDRYPLVSLPWYLSFGTWTAEATYVTWSSYLIDHGADTSTLDQGARNYGYDVTHGLGRSIGALIGIGLALRVLAIWALDLKVGQ